MKKIDAKREPEYKCALDCTLADFWKMSGKKPLKFTKWLAESIIIVLATRTGE